MDLGRFERVGERIQKEKEAMKKMPCGKYKSKKQRGLCFLTKEWSDFSKVKKRR